MVGAITSTGKIQGTELEGTSLDINGNGDISGALTLGSTVFGTSLKVGHDSHNLIDFNTDNQIKVRINNVDKLLINQSRFAPNANNGMILGSASLGWSDLFLASGAVVNFNNGDITLTHSSNTLTVAGGQLTVSGEIEATSLDINGNADISGNLTVAGKVTAQEFHTTFVSASIMYESGSTKFGDTSDDVHNFTGSVNIDGTLSATVKSFDIDHPTQEGKRLVYGVLEGPEHAVYVRGESKEDTVILPEEWKGLVDKDTLTVQLTPIGSPDLYYYKNYENNSIIVGGPEKKHYFYYVQATRKDVEPLITVQ